MAWFGLINIKSMVPISKLSDDLSGTEVEYHLETPAAKVEETKIKIRPATVFTIQHKAYRLLKRVHNLLPIIKRFLKTIRLENLQWKTAIGTADAAETGVLTGIVWGIKSSIVGFISTNLTVRKIPQIHVHPLFQQKKIKTEIRCMIRFRIGNAILAGIRLLLNLRKRRDVKWQSTQYRA